MTQCNTINGEGDKKRGVTELLLSLFVCLMQTACCENLIYHGENFCFAWKSKLMLCRMLWHALRSLTYLVFHSKNISSGQNSLIFIGLKRHGGIQM